MSDFETKKYSTDELRPLLSLKADEKKQKDEKTKEEQDALWDRSLEFFRNMKSSTTHPRVHS